MGRNKVCILLLCVVLLTVGCTVRPKGILSSRKMERVLIDLHKADGALQVAQLTYNHDALASAYYLWVLDKHGITQAQFDSSLVWYTDHPQYFDKIYPRVIKRLEKESEELTTLYGELAETTRPREPFVPKRIDSLVNPILFPQERLIQDVYQPITPVDSIPYLK